MSLINSLFSGVSGLKNHQSMMDVIGNNIANVNSIGFKGSRVTFADTFNKFVKAGANSTENAGGTNTFQIGLGAKINSIDRNWNQGTFEQTGIVTDLALKGSGMFVLKSGGQNFYSRSGAFEFDAEGKLVNPNNGAILQGKVADTDGNVPAGNTLQDIQINPNMRLAANPTTYAKWNGNLSSSSNLTRTEGVIQSGNLDKNTAVDGTSENIDTKIYDENGDEYTLRTVYTKEAAANTWTVQIDILDSNNNSIYGGAGEDALPAAQNVVFDGTTGEMTTVPTISVTDPSNSTLEFTVDISTVTQSTSSENVASVADLAREPNIVKGTVTIFDSLGESHSLDVTFTKTADNLWNWRASINEENAVLTNREGTITFNTDGSIQGVTPPSTSIVFQPAGAESQVIELDFGEGLSGISQTSLSSSVSATEQNGSASATLSNLNIDQYGNIVGVFSNGSTQTLAQIMTATFTNLNGLIGVGDNLFTVSANSGDPVIGELGDATNTTIQSGSLEQSNVDLSEEFTKMIVSQRGFQANARVITTADTLLQEITNLVR